MSLYFDIGFLNWNMVYKEMLIIFSNIFLNDNLEIKKFNKFIDIFRIFIYRIFIIILDI